MGIAHSSLPSSLCISIESCLIHLFPDHGKQSVSTAVHGLGLMAWPWAAVRDALQDVILAAMPTMTAADLALTANGIASMGGNWTELHAG